MHCQRPSRQWDMHRTDPQGAIEHLAAGPQAGGNIGYRLHWALAPYSWRLQGPPSRGERPDHQPALQRSGSAMRGCHPHGQHQSSPGEAYSDSLRLKQLQPADGPSHANVGAISTSKPGPRFNHSHSGVNLYRGGGASGFPEKGSPS